MPTIKRDKKKKEGSYTVGDLLTVVGFVILMFATYLGCKLLSGNFTEAIVTTAIVTAVCVLFVWLLCTAKKAYNHRQAWMWTEYTLLVVFVVVFFVATGWARHFQYITTVKDQLHTDAIEDRETILGIFATYEAQEKADMGEIYNSIKSLPTYETLGADEETKERLLAWKGENSLKWDRSYSQDELNHAAQAYDEVLQYALMGPQYRALRSAYTEKVDSVVNSISDAKYDDYHAASKRLALYYDGAAEELTRLSASRAKYELNMEYGLLTSHQMPREYTADTDELKLQSHFDGTPHATTAGWCYTAGVLLLVLCPYFATRRSRRVTALSGGFFGRKKRTFTNDGGIDIC